MIALFKFASGRREFYTIDVLGHDTYTIHDRPVSTLMTFAEMLAARERGEFDVIERVFERIETRYPPDWQGPLESPAWWFERGGRNHAPGMWRREFKFVEMSARAVS